MQRYSFVIYILLTLAWLTSCELIDYHPYEGKVDGETGLIAHNLPLIEQRGVQRETFRFAFMSDTQRHYDETRDCVRDINDRDDLDFVLHGGDLTDFGLTDEFEWMRDCLLKLQLPWLCILGNHDTLGNGEHIYTKVFGPFNYGFTFGHIRFECINTNALEFDNSDKVPDFDFLRSELRLIEQINTGRPDSIRSTIFLMHSRPDDEQFNQNVAEYFEYVIRQFPGMSEGTGFCLNGHNHHTEIREPFSDGVFYYGVSDISDRQYLIFTLHADGSYAYETIDF